MASLHNFASTVHNWLDVAGGLASILGLIITFRVWRQVKTIKRTFTLRGRLPELSTAISDISRELLNTLSSEDVQSSHFRAQIERLNGVLINLMALIDNPQRGMARQLHVACGGNPGLLSRFRRRHSKPISRDRAWDIYYKSQGLIESLEQTAQDLHWR